MIKKLLLLLIFPFISNLAIGQFNFAAKKKVGDTGTDPQVIMTGDVNNDDFDDILVASRTSNDLDLYINDLENSGDFIKVSISNTLSDILGIAFGDFNSDGFQDIIATGAFNGVVAWYPNDQSGGFSEERVIGVIGFPATVVTGKIDGDDTVDFATAVFGSGETLWYANDGNGNFSTANTIDLDVSSGPIDLDMEDFDGDGDLDVVVGNLSSGTVELYNNRLVPDGTATFVKYDNTVATGSQTLFDVLIADINDDGKMEIIKSDAGGQGAISYYTTSNNTTTTTFTEVPLTLFSTENRIGDLAVADFNGDGYNDLFYANSQGNGDVIGYESDDSGGLNAAVYVDNTQAVVYSIAVADFDNDQSLDFASADNNNAEINIFINDLVLGVDDYEIEGIKIHPNPVSTILNFEGFNGQKRDISIFNNMGQKIMETTLNLNNKLDVSLLNAGIYFLKIKEQFGTFKFIKN